MRGESRRFGATRKAAVLEASGGESVAGLTVVDTDILIDAGRGISEAIGQLADLEHRSALAVSVVTQMELIVGCRNKAELRDLERFRQRFSRTVFGVRSAAHL